MVKQQMKHTTTREEVEIQRQTKRGNKKKQKKVFYIFCLIFFEII